MKSSYKIATVVAALCCSILLCFTVAPCVGFQQQPLRPVPCGFAGCQSKSLHSSSLDSTPNQFSRFGGRLSRQQQQNKLVWWSNNRNQQKPNSSLLADVAASAPEEKKGFFDKVGHNRTFVTTEYFVDLSNIHSHVRKLITFLLQTNLLFFFSSFKTGRTSASKPIFEIDQIDRSSRRRTQKACATRPDVLCHSVQLHHLARHKGCFDGYRSEEWSRGHSVYQDLR